LSSCPKPVPGKSKSIFCELRPNRQKRDWLIVSRPGYASNRLPEAATLGTISAMLEKDLAYLTNLFDQAALALPASQEALANGQVLPPAKLEAPRQSSHGDLACSLAMQCAKVLRLKPREIAEQLAASVVHADRDSRGLIEAAEVAGAGFINLRLSLKAKQAVLQTMVEQGEVALVGLRLAAAVKCWLSLCQQTRRARCMWAMAVRQRLAMRYAGS